MKHKAVCAVTLVLCSDAIVVLHFHKNNLEGVVDPLINFNPEPFNFVVLKSQSIGASVASIQE